MKVIVIDIDNCWLDSRLWIEKAPFGSKKEEDWDLFYKRVYLCRPNRKFIKDVLSLLEETKLFPLFVTSRSDKIRKSTIFQIQNYSPLLVDKTCFLYMRKDTGFYRKSDEIKRELLEEIMKEHEVIYAIDDMDTNLQVFKDLNIETVIKYDIEKHDYEKL